MLIDLFAFEGNVRSLHVILGLCLGLVFGISAQASGYCLRRVISGTPSQRASAGAVWVTSLAVALIGMFFANFFNLIALEAHHFFNPSVPVVAIFTGGLIFGAGMILTRGCVSRLTVLLGTGNLRALFVLLTFVVTAHATMKGVLTPVRASLGSLTVDLPAVSLSALPLLFLTFAIIAVIAVVLLIRFTRPQVSHVGFGAVIGLVAVGGWVATSKLLFDEFDPLPVQSAAFTLPWSDSLFWLIASTSIPAGFGVGFISGVLSGSFLSASFRGELKFTSFATPIQTFRYLAGGALMGLGGVLAGGCTVGAGLSGLATGSFAAFLALIAIILGGWITTHIMSRGYQGAVAAA
ncbi:MAG: YeeE/YedE family protein [Aestuariivita sp.]|nr:YeeE/YedE family protein [Aestuariivita sp.]